MPGGRPTAYTEELGLKICSLIARGMPLTKICKRDGMPCLATVYGWMWGGKEKCKHPEFLDMYEQARLDQADTLADEIIEIADDGENDTYTNEDGFAVVRNDVVQRSRLRVDARKWVAAKLKPKKYGDQLKQDMTLSGGENPIQVIAVEGFTSFEGDSDTDDQGS